MSEFDPQERAAIGVRTAAELHMFYPAAPRTPVEAAWRDFVYAEVWTRPGLDQRSRRLITIVAAADSQAPGAVRSHTYSAMASGDFTKDEMLEIVEQYAVHGGHTRGSTMQALMFEIAEKIENGEPFTVAAHGRDE